MIGGGAGNAPSTTTTGTGVLTALGNPAGGASGFAALNSSGYLPVSQGGTGQSSALTQYGVIYGSSTTAMATTSAGATNYVLAGNTGGAPTFQSFLTLLTTIANALPTSLPGSAGVLWNNGGVISIS
jgi:hypothetical protein